MSKQPIENFHKGWICLDIDGTLTDQMLSIPQNVTDYLKEVYLMGWNVIFVTGRMFSLGIRPLEGLDFPFYFIPQNGASWFEMPGRVMLGKKYLELETVLQLEHLICESKLDFVLITGIDDEDQCFYRPARLKPEIVQYFENSLSQFGGIWRAVLDFKNLPVQAFAYAKIYGTQEELEPIYHAFHRVPAIKSHLIRDSAHPRNFVLHVMRSDVDKGKAVLEVIDQQVMDLPIIAAGNDCNDETLLDIADIKIAMPNSPASLMERATLIAPPVEEQGIITALKLAIKQVEE